MSVRIAMLRSCYKNDEGARDLCQNTVSQDVLGKQRFLESVIYKS